MNPTKSKGWRDPTKSESLRDPTGSKGSYKNKDVIGTDPQLARIFEVALTLILSQNPMF